MTTIEGWHTVEDGTKLYTKTWTTDEPPKAILAFVHGFSDHCNAHYRVTLFPTLASRGIEVHAFDQRGWGRSVTSKSQRGLTGGTLLVLADITSFLASIPPSPVPLFLMGHSMGGAEILHYALQPPSSSEPRARIRGFIAQAPLIALHPSAAPFKITVLAGRLAGKVFPKRQMVNKLDSKWLCRDPAVCKEWEEDELCHDTGTLEGLAGMLDRGIILDKMEKPVIEGAPLVILHGNEDRVTSCPASERFVERAQVEKGKEHKMFPGFYHNLHAEPGDDKVRFANEVAEWVLEKAGQQGQGGGEAGDRAKL